MSDTQQQRVSLYACEVVSEVVHDNLAFVQVAARNAIGPMGRVNAEDLVALIEELRGLQERMKASQPAPPVTRMPAGSEE